MTQSIVSRSFNDHGIRIRVEDRYVCLTDMAKASGKLFADWMRLKSTNAYLTALSESMGIPIDRLVEVNESSGGNELRGTWGHPEVATDFAQWCSIPLRIQVNRWTTELIETGIVTTKPMTEIQMLAALAQKMADEEQARIRQQQQLDEQARRQDEIQKQLDELNQVKITAHKELIALPPSVHEVPPESTDMKVRRIVNTYAAATGIQQAEVYRNLYIQHYYRYRRRPEQLPRESKLQCFVRLGLIESLYDLAIELFGQAA